MDGLRIVDKSYFTPVLEKLCLELLEAAQCILVVGSFAEGLNTSTSDIDLFVVTKKDYSGKIFHSGQDRRVDGKVVEVSILPESKIELAFSRYMSKSYVAFDPRELEYIHKICNSIIIYGEDSGCELRRRFDKHIFSINMKKYYGDYLADIYLDFVGSIAEVDTISAIGFADFMIETAADAWLAKCGDTYPKSKWRGKRINRLAQVYPEVVGHYLQHVYQLSIDRLANSDSYFTASFALVRRLKCATHFGIAPDEPESRTGTLYDLAKPFFITENEQGFYCKERDKVYSVDLVSGAILLCFYESRSLESTINQVLKMIDDNYDLSIDVEGLEKRFKSFLEAGWIKQVC